MKLPPDLESRYCLGAALGRGGFGTVYRATPRAGGPEVALKILDADHDPARFAREVEALRRIDHPHVLRCLDAGEGWLALELARGTAEDLWLDPDRVGEAWQALVAAARGAAALHEAGIAHRDLKPENLLRVDDRWVVADLGLARLADLETLTRTGVIQGTPGYMAPEQARGEKPGPPADVWTLGVMAYELVEGRSPWPAGEPPLETLIRVARGERPGWAQARGRLAPAVLAAVQAALEPEPGKRPRDLAAWAAQLEAGPPAARAAGATREPATQVVGGGGSAATLAKGATISVGQAIPVRGPRWGAGGMAAVVLSAALLWWWFPAGDTESSPVPGAREGALSKRTPEELMAGAARALQRLEADFAADAAGNLVEWTPQAVDLAKVDALAPVAYPQVEAALPVLAEWRRRWTGGLRAEELPEELREQMRELDAGYLAAGLPRPFHPMAHVFPTEQPVRLPDELHERLAGQVLLWTGAKPDNTWRGWLGAAAMAMKEAATAAGARQVDEARVLAGEQPARATPPWIAGEIGLRRDVLTLRERPDHNSALRSLDRWYSSVGGPSRLWSPEKGARSWRYYALEQGHHDEAAYALYRSLEAEPESRATALALLVLVVWDPRQLVLHPARSGVRLFPPWLPESEEARVLVETSLQWTSDRYQDLVGKPPAGAEAARRRRGPQAVALARRLAAEPELDLVVTGLTRLLGQVARNLYVEGDAVARADAIELAAELVAIERAVWPRLSPWLHHTARVWHLREVMDDYEDHDRILPVHQEMARLLIALPYPVEEWGVHRAAFERLRAVVEP